MHIHKIVIQGFKSYKNQTIAGPFSKHHNVVVGRNGSGKSNFFAAIRFVLGDAFKTLGKDDRTQLLHDGAGTSVMSAYVEVVFDNSDGRMMGRGNQVVVRRTVGLKKDEYSLDKKSSSKQEIANLLETAGFSPSNPYYIVPQGRVTSLTNARDAERLKLLKEVAGTEVYETKRSRSLALMAETQTKREQIDESLQSIHSQMDELEEETKLLKDYQEKDREKRCLDYTLMQRELADINSKLDEIDEEMNNGAENNTTQIERLKELEEQTQQLDTKLAELNERKKTVDFEKQQAQQDVDELISEHATAEMEANEYATSASTANQELVNANNELKTVEKEIHAKTRELNKTRTKYTRLKTQESEMKNELNGLETRKNHLQVKQGRSSQFQSADEYKRWHESEIESLQRAIDQKTRSIETTNSDVQDLDTQLEESKQKQLELQTKLDSLNSEKKSLKQQEAEFTRREAALNDEKKALWREQNQLQSRLDTAKTGVNHAEKKLSETMARDMSNGLKSIEKIVKRMNLQGVKGTLSELIDFDDKYKVAVETVAGTSLFHVVVDTDETAGIIMEELKRERSGRVTFVPMNRLDPQDIEYPEADGAMPLINKIQYDGGYHSVVQQVFGRAMVCKNLEIGQQVAQPNGLNAITLQGDRLDNQGVLTGGYTDTRKSRMDATRRLRAARQELAEREQEFNDVSQQLQVKEQEITQLLNERSRALTGGGESAEDVQQELHAVGRTHISLSSLIESKNQEIEDKKSSLISLEGELESHRADLQTGFNVNLSDEEQQELDSARTQIPKLQRQLNELSVEVTDSSTEKSNLEFSLNETLTNSKTALQSKIQQLEEESLDSERHNELAEKVERLQAQRDEYMRKMAELDKELEQISKQTEQADGQLSRLREEQVEVGRALEKQRKHNNSRMARKTDYTQRKENVNSRVRELGVIPEDAWGKYKKMSSTDIVQRNKELSEQLKDYSYVNKKALEQYNTFKEKREDLEKRREELVTSEESITQLIDTLDQRKDEAIVDTFKQVAESFATVFFKLVPAGVGRLIMQKRSDDATSQSQTQTQMGESTTIENYIGVSISVSFNSQVNEQLRIEQLSGGQKSLCALALIFAIQMCDPAPFYLFDEVDANLDTQYRTAVADMIKEMAKDGQFICTTFRPEMIDVANGFYGVSFKDSMSSISQITKEEAAEFIEGANRT